MRWSSNVLNDLPNMIKFTFDFLGEVSEKVEPSQCGQVEGGYKVANNSFTVYVS